MKLGTYLKQNGLRQAAFAERLGVTPATVSRLVTGALQPSLPLAGLIEQETGGAVPMSEWLDEAQQRGAA